MILASALPITGFLASCSPGPNDAAMKLCLHVAQDIAGDTKLHEWPAKSIENTPISDGMIRTTVTLGSPPPDVAKETQGNELPPDHYVACFFKMDEKAGLPQLSQVTSWRGESDPKQVAAFAQELSNYRFIGPWMIRK